MIGLNTSIFKSAGRKLVNLLGALKDRAAYYENGTDSTAEKNHIDDLGVLDKATILLTPTATSNALVHSVKTYTGDELVTNGTFDTETDWTFTNITFSAGAVLFDSVGDTVFQNFADTINTRYKITVTKTGEGTLRYRTGYAGSDGTIRDIPESGIVYFTSTSDTNRIQIYGDASSVNATLNSVSVVEVASDFDFDRASSATRINSSGLVQDMQSITDPELVLNGDFEELGSELVTNGDFATDSNWTAAYGESQSSIVISNNQLSFTSTVAYGFASQEINVISGKTYKLLVDIDSFSGSMRIFSASGNDAKIISSTGLIEFYFVPDANTTLIGFSANNDVGASVVVNSISIKQVDPNDRWSLDTDWSIEDGQAKFGGSTAGYLVQLGTLEVGKTYKIKADVSQGRAVLISAFYDIHGSDEISSEGNIFTVTSGTDLRIYSHPSNGTTVIDNISVKDITFSTDVDLARINYDSNGENGHILLEPTSTNLVGYSIPNNTNWSKGTNTTITENYAVSPDGTQNASRFVMPTGSGTYAYYQFTATSTTDHTLSFYAKNNGGDADVTMSFFAASQTKNITLTNEWQRFEFTTSITSGNAVQVGVDNITSVDMLIYGVQCEALSYATSYIPTLTGSTVTRAVETLAGSGNSTLINSTEGVLYLDIAMLSEGDKDSNSQIFLSTGTSSERVGIFAEQNGDIRAQIRDNDETITSRNVTLLDQSDIGVDTAAFNKIAILYKSGQNKVFVNGSRIISNDFDSFVFNYSLKQLNFDSGNGTGNYFRGKVKAAAVFNEALEDDELELLTGVTNYGSFGELASASGYTII